MLLLVFLVSPAHAWRHLDTAWEDFPIAWYLDDQREDSLPAGYDEQALKDAWENWNSVACASCTNFRLGMVTACGERLWRQPGRCMAVAPRARSPSSTFPLKTPLP